MLSAILPHTGMLHEFLAGRIRTLQYDRERKPPKNRGRDTWEMKYSFEDAHEVISGMIQTFQSFWQSECMAMKDQLVSMDTQKTGRVPMSKFYGTGIDSEWRFGESEEYLRELGALDESSTMTGPQVI